MHINHHYEDGLTECTKYYARLEAVRITVFLVKTRLSPWMDEESCPLFYREKLLTMILEE